MALLYSQLATRCTPACAGSDGSSGSGYSQEAESPVSVDLQKQQSSFWLRIVQRHIRQYLPVPSKMNKTDEEEGDLRGIATSPSIWQ
jgi:hypothetical protein